MRCIIIRSAHKHTLIDSYLPTFQHLARRALPVIIIMLEYIIESMAYVRDFVKGRGFDKYNCWGCDAEIEAPRKVRFQKCDRCWCLNIHPVWGRTGENSNTFTKRIAVTAGVIMALLGLYILGIWCLIQLIY